MLESLPGLVKAQAFSLLVTRFVIFIHTFQMFDPSLKKKKKKKKTGFDLDAALGGESGVTETPPADDEQKQDETPAPVSEKIDGEQRV